MLPDNATDLGRIGGGLLAPNLQFQGSDVQFDTDLLYLDVANNRVGINSFGAQPNELYLNGDQILQTINLITDGTTTNNNWTISSNNISPGSGTLYLTPDQTGTPTIVANGVGSSDISITDRLITNLTANSNINITPNGTGIVNATGNMTFSSATKTLTVTGNGYVTGNLYANGTYNIGNQTTDTVSFTADVTSDLKPSATNTDSLGTSGQQWNTVYANQPFFNNQTTTSATLGGITFSGNTIYSADNSLDITLAPTGTGRVLLNGYQPFSSNNILNPTANPYTLAATQDGYTNFAGNNAVVFPIGTTAQRVTTLIGTTRYNTTNSNLEIYTGSTWINAIGASPPATQAQMNDLGVIFDIILG